MTSIARPILLAAVLMVTSTAAIVATPPDIIEKTRIAMTVKETAK